MKKVKLVLFTLLLTILIKPVHAQTIEHFTAKAEEDISLTGQYNSSVAVAGQDIDLEGKVEGISVVAGNKIDFEGNTDYAIFAGNNINLKNRINKDAVIAGNVITTTQNSIFGRDTIILASDIDLSGKFERNVSVYGNKVTIRNSTINGNIKINATNITVDNAIVEGTLSYPEDSSIKINQNCHISHTKKTPAIQTKDEENYFNTLTSKFYSFLSLILIYAAMSLFLPKLFTNINERYAEFELNEGVEAFTKGLVVIILIPIIALLLCCTMIGIPLGIISLILYGISIYLSSIFTAYLLGYKVWQKFFDKDAHILFFGIIGLFILFILKLIPGIRVLVSIISTLIGLGLIFETIKKA